MAGEWTFEGTDYYADIQQTIPGIGITSGFRTKEYQEDMRKRGYTPAENSEHLEGAKLDLTPPSGRDFDWLEQTVRTTYPEAQILREGDHLDVRFPGWKGAPALGGAAAAGITNPNRVEGLPGNAQEAPASTEGWVFSEEAPADPVEKSWADWGREFASSAQVSMADVPGYTQQVRSEGYMPLINALMERGKSVNDYRFGGGAGILPDPIADTAQWNYKQIFEDAVAEGLIEGGDPERIAAWEAKRDRVVDGLMEGKSYEEINEELPGFLPKKEEYDYWAKRVADGFRGEIPFSGRPEGMTQESFEKSIMEDFRENLAEDEEVVENSDWAPFLAGSLAGAIPDRFNVIPGGGPASSRLKSMGMAALENMALEGAETPLINAERVEQGRPEMTTAEVALGIGSAGVLGAGLGAVGRFGTKASETPVVAPATKKGRPRKVNLARVQDSVKATAQGWEAAPEYVVVKNANELPEPRRAEVLNSGMENDAKGFYSPADKKVYILADNVESMDEVPAIVFHESLGHAGLDRQFRAHLDGMMDTLYKNNPKIKELVDKRILDDDIYDGNIARNVEEILAERSENGVIDSSTWEKIKHVIKQYVRKMGLNLKVTDAEVDAILARAHETVTRGTKKAGAEGGQNRFMNVGDQANLPISSQSARVRAAAMTDRGASSEEVFEATGWWKDQDGGWRERLSDEDSGLIINPELNSPRIYELGDDNDLRLPLSEVFDHPRLYEAYPFLRDIPVRNTYASVGSYNPASHEIGINVAQHGRGKEDFRETILHEIQHAIQRKEGWAQGGNPHTALQKTLKDEEIPEIAQNLLQEKKRQLENLEIIYENLSALWRDPEIKEHRQIFDAMREAESLGFDSPEYKTWTKRYHDSRVALIKKLGRQEFEAMRDIVIFDRHPAQKLHDLRTMRETEEEDILDLEESIEQADMFNDPDSLRPLIRHDREIKYEAYEWLLGEIEARETGKLRNKSDDDLRKIGPGIGKTERIDPSYARITRDEAPAASMPGEFIPRRKVDGRMRAEDRKMRNRARDENTRAQIEALKARGIDPADAGLPSEPELRFMSKKKDLPDFGKQTLGDVHKALREQFDLIPEKPVTFHWDDYDTDSGEVLSGDIRLGEVVGEDRLDRTFSITGPNGEPYYDGIATYLWDRGVWVPRLVQKIQGEDFNTSLKEQQRQGMFRRSTFHSLEGEYRRHLLEETKAFFDNAIPRPNIEEFMASYRKMVEGGPKFMRKRPLSKGRQRLEAKKAAAEAKALSEAKKTKNRVGSKAKAGNINLTNVRSNANVKQVLRDALEEFEPEGRKSQAEVKKLARDLGVTSEDVIKDDLGMTAEKAYAYRQVMLRTAQEVVNWANRIDAGDNSDAIMERFAAAFARHAAVQEQIMKLTANAGRVLNQFNIAASGRTAGNLRAMMKDNPSIISDPKSLKQLAEQVIKYKDKPAAMNKMTRDAFDPKFEDYILSYWYNNVLSGLATHTANMTGTATAFIQSFADLSLAAILGQRRRFSKQAERVMIRELAARLYGAGLGFAQGIKNAPRAFKEGVPTHQVSKVERNTLIMKGPFKALEVPVRMLAAEDEFFRNIIQLSDYYGLAYREAAKSGGGNKKIWKQVKENVANPTAEMVEHSDEYARTIQFLSTPSEIIKGLERFKHRRPNDHLGLRMLKLGTGILIPFARVTDNLARFAARNSPLAVVSPTNWRMLKKGGPDRDIAMARIGLGIMQGYWVINEALKGDITGAGPADYRERERLMATGWQPYSIRTDDGWVSYQGFEPASISIGVMATVADRVANDEESEGAVDSFIKGALSTSEAVIDNIGWLESMKNILAIGDQRTGEVNAANIVGGLASSFAVPAAVRQANSTFIDKTQRDTTGDGGFFDRVGGRVQAGVPGMSDDLPARHDALGRTRENHGAIGPDIASRAKFSPEDTDPVVQELHRLGVMPNRARKSDISSYVIKPTAEDLQEYQRVSGYYITEDVRDFMASEDWQNMDDAERAEEIEKIIKTARKAAKEELFVNGGGEGWTFSNE